jgi:enoyl-CoA hydratase/carnithine racemase
VVSKSIDCEFDGAVAFVTLSYPARFNAMSRTMWLRLREVFETLAHRTDLRCVVVRGANGHFCAGGDIAEYPDFRFDEAQLRHFHEVEVWGGLSAMLRCDIPIVACIEGNCMGAGVEIASCCDIRIAADNARFGAPIARLGFPMAPREARLVAYGLGHVTAREMLLEAAVLDAAVLAQRGFLHQVLPASDLMPKALQRAQGIARLAPQAARLNKHTLRVLSGVLDEPAPQSPAAELFATAYHYAAADEHQEGITAFLAKRPPSFQ